MTDAEKIRRAKAEYAKQYRREHPDRVKATQEKYWLKKAQIITSEGENKSQPT